MIFCWMSASFTAFGNGALRYCPSRTLVAFRTEYEERFRAAWDRGEEGVSKALVLQLQGTDLNTLPWDYVRMGRKASLSWPI